YLSILLNKLSIGESGKANESQSLHKQLAQLIGNIEKIIATIETESDIKQFSPKLLKLLEEWTQLASKSELNLQMEARTDGNNKKEQKLWQDLLAFYQKRTGLGKSTNPYNKEAAVTTKDIASWLKNALGSNLPIEATSQAQQQTQTS